MEAVYSREEGAETIFYNRLTKEIFSTGEPPKHLRSPAFVIWDITPRCNLKCKYCSSHGLEGELGKKQCFDVINRLGKAGVFWVQISGGEPLVRKDIFEILAYLKSKKIDTELYTNATLIDKKVAKRLKESGVGNVNISMEGLKGTYEITRGIGNFKKVLNGMNSCISAGLEVIPVIPIVKSCSNDITSLTEMLKSMCIKKVKVIDLMPVGLGRNVYDKESLSREELENTVSQLKASGLEIIPEVPIIGFEHTCDAAKTFFRIAPNGEATPCSFFSEEFSGGNINKRSINEIWNSDSFRKVRNAKLPKECFACVMKKECAGGCKIRSLIKYGNFSKPDPRCARLESFQ